MLKSSDPFELETEHRGRGWLSTVVSRFALIPLIALFAAPLQAQGVVTLTIRDVIERQALHFPTSGDTGVVLVHQSGLDAASWTEFGRFLQQDGLASIALESTSREDVEAGIGFLIRRGKQRVVLIGASIGGGAVQSAASRDETGAVVLAILLGTATGNMSDNHETEKLFVVSEGDFFSAQTYASFDNAAEPKDLLVYPGAAHGQEMLEQDYGAELARLLLDRIAS